MVSLTQSRTPLEVKTRFLPDDHWTEEEFAEKKKKTLENQEKKAKTKAFVSFQTLSSAIKEYHLAWEAAEVAASEVSLFDRKEKIKAAQEKEADEKNAEEAEKVKRELEALQEKYETLKPIRKANSKGRAKGKRKEITPYILANRKKPAKFDEEDEALAARLDTLRSMDME